VKHPRTEHTHIVHVSPETDHHEIAQIRRGRISHNYKWVRNKLIPDYMGFTIITPSVTNQLLINAINDCNDQNKGINYKGVRLISSLTQQAQDWLNRHEIDSTSTGLTQQARDWLISYGINSSVTKFQHLLIMHS